MRDFKGMKRQRGRNRGGSGNKPQHNANRAFDSNGPEGIKVRGAAQSVYEKYQLLARDAQTAGDRVLAENYLQHAEHYFRLLRAMQPQRPVAEIIGRDQFASGYDLDFEEEPGGDGESQMGEGAGEPVAETDVRQADTRSGEDRWRDDRRREERPRDDRSAGDRPKDERVRDERARDDRSRDDRPREERYRDDRGRGERSRDDRYRDDRNRDPRQDRYRGDRSRDDRPREERASVAATDPLAVVEPRGGSFAPAEHRETSTPGSPILRADDGEVSHAPAFLNVRPPPLADTPEPEGGAESAPSAPEAAASDERPTSRRRRSAAPAPAGET